MTTQPKSNGALGKTLNDDLTSFYSSEVGLVHPDTGEIDSEVLNSIENEIKNINQKLEKLSNLVYKIKSEISSLKTETIQLKDK